MDHHCQLLQNTDWGKFGSVSDKRPLRVHSGERREFLLTLSSNEASDLMVLMTVDSAAAACVNVLDNMARLLNEGYGLDVVSGPGETLSLRPTDMIRFVDKVTDENGGDTPLGRVLLSSPGTDWMGFLRKLRGECQHGKITAVVMHPERGFGMPLSEPVVAEEFCPDFVKDLRVSRFFISIHTQALELLDNVMSSVVECRDKALASA